MATCRWPPLLSAAAEGAGLAVAAGFGVAAHGEVVAGVAAGAAQPGDGAAGASKVRRVLVWDAPDRGTSDVGMRLNSAEKRTSARRPCWYAKSRGAH